VTVDLAPFRSCSSDDAIDDPGVRGDPWYGLYGARNAKFGDRASETVDLVSDPNDGSIGSPCGLPGIGDPSPKLPTRTRFARWSSIEGGSSLYVCALVGGEDMPR
jgi:hypothetical protein